MKRAGLSPGKNGEACELYECICVEVKKEKKGRNKRRERTRLGSSPNEKRGKKDET